MSARRAFHDLLCDLFPGASELRRFLGEGEDGDEIERHLPGDGTALATVVDAAIKEVQRRGLVDATLARLVESFGRRSADIQRVGQALGDLAAPMTAAPSWSRCADDTARRGTSERRGLTSRVGHGIGH
jgi:hypothetical protein